jgi:Contractile injection system tube protein/LysM domain
MAKLKKAFLRALNGSNTERIEVLFNPAEYSVESGNQFASTSLPGLESPILSFVNGNADTLTMELFFDTYTYGNRADVSEITKEIAKLMDIDPELHAPPIVLFQWGKFEFRAVIERLSQKFTMFLENGTPVRATLNVTFKEYTTVTEQVQKLKLKSADWSRLYVVTELDSLWMLADREYHDPGEWRLIADANNIENPRLLEVGSNIRLPPLSEKTNGGT